MTSWHGGITPAIVISSSTEVHSSDTVKSTLVLQGLKYEIVESTPSSQLGPDSSVGRALGF